MAEFTRDSIKAHVQRRIDLYNTKHGLFSPAEKLLIACSGNMDSVFAVYYFLGLGYDIGIAHVDHMTRNGQSTADSKFVENLANQNNTPFYLKQINVSGLVAESGNFQEIARIERYSFFESLMIAHGYTKVVIAHHGDDNVETLLMNLGRAGGLKAFRGMLPIRDGIIRPFLALRKKEIEAYVELNSIDFVIDSSNVESTYKRNYLRNEVIPVIEQKQENWVDQAMQSMEYALEIEQELEQLADKLITSHGDLHSIDISEVESKRNPHLYLLTGLSRYGFSSHQVAEILTSDKVGKKWEAGEYVLYRERMSFEIFKPLQTDSEAEYNLDVEIHGLGMISDVGELGSMSVAVPASVDRSDLVIRHKRNGDFIQLAAGKKKLKKLFSDKKVSNYEKLTLWVVARESEVFWVLNPKTTLAQTAQNTDNTETTRIYLNKTTKKNY